MAHTLKEDLVTLIESLRESADSSNVRDDLADIANAVRQKPENSIYKERTRDFLFKLSVQYPDLKLNENKYDATAFQRLGIDHPLNSPAPKPQKRRT